MLHEFIELVAEKDSFKDQSVKLARYLEKLPKETLKKLASGEMKLSFGHSEDWLEKYQGTELFDRAVALERAELENEVARTQAHASQPPMDQFWKSQDQIRIQKKMLDLQLAELLENRGLTSTVAGQLPDKVAPADTAQGSGALGDIPSEGVQSDAMGINGAKTASILAKLAGLRPDHFEVSEQLNHAYIQKEALGMPTLVGAGIGALGGAMAGGENNRLTGALGGAALGAAGGHAAGGIARRMGKGLNFSTAVQGYGRSIKRSLGFKGPAKSVKARTAKPAVNSANTAQASAAGNVATPAQAAAPTFSAPQAVKKPRGMSNRQFREARMNGTLPQAAPVGQVVPPANAAAAPVRSLGQVPPTMARGVANDVVPAPSLTRVSPSFRNAAPANNVSAGRVAPPPMTTEQAIDSLPHI